MQNTLTIVDACAPATRRSPPGVPLSVIVFTAPPPGPKAPAFRCWQLEYAPAPEQSALVLQDVTPVLGLGHAMFGSPSKQRLMGSRQKPQKTLFWTLGLFTAVLLVVPVVRA